LRLDAKHYPDEPTSWFTSLVEKAREVELDADHVTKLREEEAEALAAYRKRVAEQEAEYSDDEIVFSDEEDD
jgi:hypothetical protein